ncbi:putative LOC107395374-like protein [Nothobranchius furzeri]|uniref:LOC107395374-like protein n=1 Tax=Nothobranchius furzeri TaxID=105023 RepID=A0A9D2XBF1_NOTFU|nr:putative LOC107395374-like protein [Nothobranchius furzeri]
MMDITRVLGRGRGTATSTPLPGFGRGRAMFLPFQESSTPGPAVRDLVEGVDTSGCASHDVCQAQVSQEGGASESYMADMAARIGLSIGESIASCLESRLSTGLGSISRNPAVNTVVDPSLLNVVVHSEAKEPTGFKGDGQDGLTVQEWEELMLAFLKRKGVPVTEQAEEVLVKLGGRAREVVKVGIRSKPLISLSSGPGPIFEILKQHFSDTVSSGMPLADFYATLPKEGEDPFDYWLRLNRAMDMTEDGLKRQSKAFEYLSRDLTAMFIRHCPDPELSLIFKCKPLAQWSVTEVHDRLVEHRGSGARFLQAKTCAPHTAQQPNVKLCMQQVPSMVASTQLQEAQPADVSADRLERIMCLLERMLDQQPWRDMTSGRGGAHPRQTQVMRGRTVTPCVICGDKEHTTHYHCKMNRLCFGCHSPDHTRAACPGALQSTQTTTGSAARQMEN